MEDEIDHIEGWVVAEDTETGKKYYANIFTQETTWDKPEAITKHEENLKEAKKQARRVTKVSVKDWVAVVDPDSNQTYYFNKVTRETTWEKPAGFVEGAHLEKDEPEKKEHNEEVVFSEKPKSNSGHSQDNKFFEKTLTVVQDENKEVSKLEQYADIFRQATEYNIENTPYSPDCQLEFSTFDKEFMQKVQSNVFEEFLEAWLPKRTSWGKPVPNNKIVVYSNKSISKPITNLSKDISSIALQTFKNILSYCGERKSSKEEIRHAQKLVLIGMNSAGEIRDEIYMQIVKQLIGNPNDDKCARVWKLLAVISSVFPPTDSLFYPFLNYLHTVANDAKSSNDFKSYAKLAFKRLYRAFNDEVRKEPPSSEEIKFIEARKQIMVPFYLMTGANTYVAVESYSNALDVKEAIMKKLELNIQRLNYYSLYEICERKDVIEERFIENHERILDLYSLWEVEKKINKSKDDVPDFKMYLRVRIFYSLKETDIDSVTMFYTQMVYDVVNSRFPMKESDIITLAALQMQVDRGDYTGSSDKILKDLNIYIPSVSIDQYPDKIWLEKILPVYANLAGYKKIDAKLAYLKHIEKWPLYLSQQYFAKYSRRNPNDDDMGIPENVTIILAVRPQGIILCDANTREPILKKGDKEDKKPHEYTFAEVLTWGVSTEYFVIVVGNQDNQNKIYLETSQGRAIDFLMQAYTNISLGKSIQQLGVQSLTHGTKKTADSLKVNTAKIQNRNATVFPKKINVKDKKK